MKVETITPKTAEKMMAANKCNRPLRTSLIERYADIIKRGQWELNGETIKFDTSGTLLDGQHRLSAVILAGMPIKSYVIRDLPRKVFDTLDTGKGRTGADVLSLRGEKHESTLASAIRLLLVYKEHGGFQRNQKTAFITTRDLAEGVDKHPKLRESVAFIRSLRDLHRILAPSPASFLHYIFAEIDRREADNFFSALASGAGLAEGSPLLNLRNKLIDMIRHTGQGRVETIAICIKAWNAHTATKKSRKLRMGEAQTSLTPEAALSTKKAPASPEIFAHVNGAMVNYESMGS
jgi:hypothetical protein